LTNTTPSPDANPSTPVSTPVTPPSGSAVKNFLREIFETLGLALLLFLAINLVSARVRVDGYSMFPTLDNGEFVLVSRLSYEVGDFQRGDIIVFRPPMYPEEPFLRRLLGLPDFNSMYEDYIKRIIGLPGDTVTIGNGEVQVNGSKLTEPYITDAPSYSGEWVVPPDSLFVLGDNRNNSSDSHVWEFLPAQNVFGKALLVYWPVSDWTVLTSSRPVLAAP
jgi:signal peptidase I